jgi:hypothetical protein
MFNFGHWHKVEHLLEEILRMLREIKYRLDHPFHPFRTSRIAINFGGSMSEIPVTEAVGQSVIATAVPLEADGLTVTPGAVVSAQAWSISDPTIASQTTNADGTATYAALAAGTATVTVSATVTDADGTVGSFTATNTITVTAVTPPTGRTVSLQINFGTPA